MLRHLTGTAGAVPGAAVSGSAESGGSRHGALAQYRWRLVAGLAVSQTVGYGVLFYVFSVFLIPTAHDLHTSTPVVTGALTASLLAAAAAAVPVGRHLDRHGGRLLMTGGSIAASVLVAVWSQVTSVWQLYAVWIGIGVASAAVLYEAAFAVLVPWFGADSRAKALLAVTIVAGFASSVFLPSAGYLLADLGWRDAVLVLAVAHAALTVPFHLYIRRPSQSSTKTAPDGRRRQIVSVALHDPVFWTLGCSLLAQGAAVFVMGVLLVAALRDFGHSATFAATTAGMLGVLSVSGRLAFTAAGRRASATDVAAAVFVVQGIGVGLLPLIGRTSLGAIACVLVFGLGFGVSTLIRPAVLTARYGTEAFATLSGLLTLPLTLVKALAPLVSAAWASAAHSYAPPLTASAGCCLIGAAAMAVIRQLERRRRPAFEPLAS
ncbi:major facilitator superfamily MFS_1 [Catenulispora acidiphila DSM 44928]|uniref:Major facilitator superfamily MFS_1 n=1 Tax=Catenulispora acidiphila (strain DSM 44928 / JCM 14897 / NBRC 102108 / NRRL B-24433 / ID139908) TaxID=479433 RepID=C7Q9D4_CATAD|nr:MFS transporter [Catenulispora acidiphila]ACU74280.1 major facilitator superfamily MFS_1 [Catenulispora acidiphila DSM 44928]